MSESKKLEKNANVHVRVNTDDNGRTWYNFEAYIELDNGKKVAIVFVPKFVNKKFKYLLRKHLQEVK